jgi:Holliday junction resolvase RusA-like endonuclease
MNPELRVWVPHLPPSSNQIYVRHPQGKGRVLSDKARTFKIKAMRAVQKQGRVALLQLKQNVPYELTLAIFFEQVEVKSSSTGSRYKKIDLSNQVKLIEDTVAKAVGVDDCHNFRLLLEKHCDPENPGIYVKLREVPEEEVGLTKEAYERRGLQPTKPVRTGRSMLTERFLRGSSGAGKRPAHRRAGGTGTS